MIGIGPYVLRGGLGMFGISAVDAVGPQAVGEIELLLEGECPEFGTELHDRLARQEAEVAQHSFQETGLLHDPFLNKGKGCS